MSDFSGLLSSDYGFKPSGKSAPMSNSSSSSSSKNPTFDLGSTTTTRSTTSNSFNDRDSVFGAPKPHDFENIFGGSARVSSTKSSAAAESFDLDSMYGDSGLKATTTADSGPVFDKPVYDDDIFDGVAGLKSSTANDIFSTVSSPPSRTSTSGFDDLLGGFRKAEPPLRPPQWSSKSSKGVPGFDDLLPGFGGSSSPQTERPKSESNWPPETSTNATKSTSKGIEDPFGVAEQYNDPLEEMSRLSNSGSLNADSSSVDNGRAFDDLDPFDGLGKSVPAFSSRRSYRGKDTGNLRADTSTNNGRGSTSKESTEKSSVRSPDNHQSQKKVPVSNPWDSHQTLFDMPSVSTDSYKSSGQAVSPPSYVHVKDANVQPDRSPISEGNLDSSDNDIWLTVSEIPLMTQPTSAPPPSRPPPPRSVQVSKPRMGSPSTNSRKKASESSTQFVPAPKSATAAARGSGVSSIDELEDFAMGKSQSYFDEHANGHSGEDLEMNSVADAMKEAMDRAEAKFRQAKERGSTKSTRSKEAQEKEKERLHTENEEEDMEQRRREKEREAERVWEEKEREQRKLEKERERSRERDMARQAVERATREARERAAAEAQLKAERAKAERAAVDRANAEARQRAEKAAVQRVQNEARERAAAEAKERAERAAAEARERANAEAKEREAAARTRSERAAVERAAAEARERAAAEARERAAAARANQQRNETDLDDFFSAGRPSSAPRPRANSSDPFSAPFQNRQEPEVPKTSRTTSSNIKKASSTTNIADDLTSIFSAAPSSDQFQEVEGETDERRRARLERHQRTKERTEKAIAEKNERDLQVQRDQAERDRISQTLDGEIKRWAAGKEGNLRALLSTLQYVLWPQCGWQPVSLTDMISAAQVKKVYRKATLCIHPDKVQQKGANLQQKYVAEKVFDLLKEAWNKFNSEELF